MTGETQNRIDMINAALSGDDAGFAAALAQDAHLHNYCVLLQRLATSEGGNPDVLKKALSFGDVETHSQYQGAVSFALSNIVGNARPETNGEAVRLMVEKLGDDTEAKTRILSFAFSTAARPGQPLPAAHIAKILVDAGADVDAAFDVHAALLESQKQSVEDALFRLQKMRAVIAPR